MKYKIGDKKKTKINCIRKNLSILLIPRYSCLITVLFFMLLLSFDKILHQHLAEKQFRINYLELIHKSRQNEHIVLLQYLVNLTEAAAWTNYDDSCFVDNGWPNEEVIKRNRKNGEIVHMSEENDGESNLLNVLSYETKMILRISTSFQLKYPSIMYLPRRQFLPHLLSEPINLQLSYLLTKNRTGFDMVLGIPTVKRKKKNYLMKTLKNIIANMKYEEQQKTLIIIYIGETEINLILLTSKIIQNEFKEHVNQGLIEIIAPLESYYPNFSELRDTLDDNPDRVQWRSKENLDTSLLMAYAKSKGTYYVQLEDDIVSKNGFINTMLQYQEIISTHTNSWFLLEFSSFGSIGKMFKSHDLPWLITYLQIFYNEKPIDWLIKDIKEIKLCDCKENYFTCRALKSKYCFEYKRSQFQHIGKYSSLKGKLQRRRDKRF